MGSLAKFATFAALAALRALMKPTPQAFSQQMASVIQNASTVRR